MKASKAEIAVFVSGGGTNLQALIDAQKSGIIEHGEIKLVVSSNPNAYALERAAKAGIKSVTVSKKEFGSQAAVEEKIIEILEENNIDLIVLAGYMSILSADFTRRYERRIINVHPSLIPSFCGEGFFCKHGFVNNCTDANGGWALGCRIDGGQAEYVRVPFADQGLDVIPDTVTDEQALFVGDILATGYWAARISEIKPEDTVLIIGAGPTGLCTLLCAMLKKPRNIIVCEQSEERRSFVREHYDVMVTTPEECKAFVDAHSAHGGADVVIEAAGGEDTFQMAWKCARPNAIVTIVALYEKPQMLPLPDMYGKNLTFKTGGVDGCDCAEILRLIDEGKIDTTPLITHRYPLSRIDEAYKLFESKADGVIKVAITNL